MLSDLSRTLDREDTFSCSDFIGKVINQGTCCVCFDRDIKQSRFCDCRTYSADSTDYLDCGSVEESMSSNLSALDIKKRYTVRFARHVLRVAMVVSFLIGLVVLLKPEYLLFNVVSDHGYQKQLQTEAQVYEELSERLRQLELSKKPEYGGLIDQLIGILNIESKESVTQEKDILTKKLGMMDDRMEEERKEQMMAIAPMKMYGAVVFFYFFMSVFHYFKIKSKSSNNSLVKDSGMSLSYDIPPYHIAWYAANFVGCAIASAGTGQGVTSSHFTFFWLAYNLVSGMVWIYLREKFNNCYYDERMNSNAINGINIEDDESD